VERIIKTVEQKIVKFILDKKLVNPGDSLLVALSGGPDSVFLLEFLLKYKKRFNINVAAFHLNHNMRGREAGIDEEFCKALAVKKGVRFYSSSKNVKLFAKRHRISLEEAGRELRYRELFKIAKRNDFTKIATAHNADDNTETVLLNLIKGAGLKGLSGIPEKRDKIIRPILILSKEEILSYLNKKKISYRTDSSNFESDYQRNYIRNEIIPLIKKKLNPQFDSAILKTSEIMKNISSFVEDQIQSALQKTVVYKNRKIVIDLRRLEEYDARFYGDLFRKAAKKYFDVELENVNISDLKKLVTKQTGKEVEFEKGIIAIKERNSIIIQQKRKQKKKIEQIQLNIGEKKQFERNTLIIGRRNRKNIHYDNSGKREYIAADKLKGSLILRRWTDGDRFYPLGMKHSKKVSDFLNENKVESHKKKKQLVVTNSGNIVWVVGMRIDERYKITVRTKDVLELCLT
jgi:tRNA(Ile)-lysidine synthase